MTEITGSAMNSVFGSKSYEDLNRDSGMSELRLINRARFLTGLCY